MATRINFVVRTGLGVCALVGLLALETQAQIDLQETFTGVPMARRQWEQRVLGRAEPHPAQNARYAGVPNSPGMNRAAPGNRAAGGPAGRVRQASAIEEYELTPAEAARVAAEGVYLEPLPNGGIPGRHPSHGVFTPGMDGCADCHGGWGGCDVTYEHHGACGHGGCGDCDDYYAIGPLWWLSNVRCRGLLRDLSVFAGVHGFKGPLDEGRNGNFGFHEGVNFGSPLGGPWGLGYQIGVNVVHSNFTGSNYDNEINPGQDRNQVFFTAGIFSRQCIGLNSGVAFDYLSDSYYTNASLKQIRTETSWRFPTGGELGYWGAYGLDNDRVVDGRLDPTDLFAFYYRRHFQRGGDGRLWAGFSGHGDGLFGADVRVPIGHGLALENSINYLIPKSPRSDEGQERESWAVNIRLVWYLGQPAVCALRSPYRPLFTVADNGTFMADFTRNQTP